MELILVLAVLAFLAVHTPSMEKPTFGGLCWLIVVVICALQAWRLWS